MAKVFTLRELAGLVDGDIVGEAGLEISGFGPLESAGPGDLSFLAKGKNSGQLESSAAAAFLVPRDFSAPGRTLVRVSNPYLAAAIIQNRMLKRPFVPKGIDARAGIGSGCSIPEAVSISCGAVLGERVSLGERVYIGPNAVIGDDVSIGSDCVIKANVTIEFGCEIGERVIVHPGTVIGSDGYGYATDRQGRHVKRPQLGIVRIGDDVEIGANCCIDRATFGITWIKSGTKIDNLVQVAHNVVVGENSLLVAQVGLAGSTTLGRNVVFGGNAGSSGHLAIGDGSMIAGKAAVHGDQPAGSVLAGVPAIPAKQWFRATSCFAKLPEMARELKQLRKDVARLLDGSGR